MTIKLNELDFEEVHNTVLYHLKQTTLFFGDSDEARAYYITQYFFDLISIIDTENNNATT